MDDTLLALCVVNFCLAAFNLGVAGIIAVALGRYRAALPNLCIGLFNIGVAILIMASR